MKSLANILLAAAFIAVVSGISIAQKPAVDLTAKDPRLFALEDLRPGMKGTANTVFAGTEPQQFGVEILGVLPGYPAPRRSTIIAKLSGSNVEKTGVFAGMSGSPVYIDGRLVGAIAFSFPFSKEPIAGITPIQQMIEIFEKGSAKLSAPKNRARFRSHNSRRLNGSRRCRNRLLVQLLLLHPSLKARASCHSWVNR